MQTQIVLISGKMGSGKTTTALALENIMMKPKTVAVVQQTFAAPIYHMHNFCRAYLQSIGIKFAAAVDVKDGKLLQLLGTEWGRNTVGPDIWVDACRGEIKKTIQFYEEHGFQRLVIVIADARFPNEFYGFNEALRVRLECTRDVRKVRAEMWRENEMHPSEIGLDDYVHAGKFDMIFDTANASSSHCATLIAAQLDKNVWMEKRL